MTAPPELVLASGSPHRRKLLDRLGLAYAVVVPEADETPGGGESATDLVRRLARAKAEAVARGHSGAVVIGGDQVAECDNRILGKPGDRAAAIEQLAFLSGREVAYRNGLAVVLPGGDVREDLLTIRVRMRRLTVAEIERYLERERPYDCAGSLKSEGYGITLVEAIESDDPSALVGLSLIRLCRLLREAGFELP